MISLHETCQEYVARRLSEGWKIVLQRGNYLILSSPDGNILRPVDLRNDVETLRPSAAGDETELTVDDSGSNWEMVDEVEPDEETTRVKTPAYQVTYLRDLYNIADHSAASGTINFVKVYARCNAYKVPSQASLKIAIKTGGTAYEGSEETLENGWVNYSYQWTQNPGNAHDWTWDEIDNLQIGVSMRRSDTAGSSRSYCTQVYVEVDYTAGATEKTSSDSGAGADALYSLEKGEVKTSSDAGSGVEGAPMQSAVLAGNETGSGIEAPVARLLAAFDTGTGVEVGGLLKDLFATELGRGSDSLAVKIEMPTKGGGMKLWM